MCIINKAGGLSMLHCSGIPDADDADDTYCGGGLQVCAQVWSVSPVVTQFECEWVRADFRVFVLLGLWPLWGEMSVISKTDPGYQQPSVSSMCLYWGCGDNNQRRARHPGKGLQEARAASQSRFAPIESSRFPHAEEKGHTRTYLTYTHSTHTNTHDKE